MTQQKSLKIRTKVRAGAIVKNHNARPKKVVKPTNKLAAKRVRGTKTGVRAGACDGAAKDGC